MVILHNPYSVTNRLQEMIVNHQNLNQGSRGVARLGKPVTWCRERLRRAENGCPPNDCPLQRCPLNDLYSLGHGMVHIAWDGKGDAGCRRGTKNCKIEPLGWGRKDGRKQEKIISVQEMKNIMHLILMRVLALCLRQEQFQVETVVVSSCFSKHLLMPELGPK